jgi:hypothetical protein
MRRIAMLAFIITPLFHGTPTHISWIEGIPWKGISVYLFISEFFGIIGVMTTFASCRSSVYQVSVIYIGGSSARAYA